MDSPAAIVVLSDWMDKFVGGAASFTKIQIPLSQNLYPYGLLPSTITQYEPGSVNV